MIRRGSALGLLLVACGGAVDDVPKPADAVASTFPCDATAIVSGQSGISGIAVDDARVYSTSFAGISACPLDGCAGAATLLASDRTEASQIVAAAARLYWVGALSYGTISFCDSRDCAATRATFAPNAGLELRADGTSLYWRGTKLIAKCPLAGCAGAPQVLATPAEPAGFALAGGMLYFFDRVTRTIHECMADGCAQHDRVVMGGLPQGWLVGADDASIYFVHDYADGSSRVDIDSCPRSGCTELTVLAARRWTTDALAIDSTHFYWAEGSVDGRVLRCPKTGCRDQPTVIAQLQFGPGSITLDATSVYWSTSDGQVMKCAK